MNKFHVRVRRPWIPSALKRAGPIAAGLAVMLVLVPTASAGTYSDATGDAGTGAGDIAAVTVMGDKQGGQIVFRIAGTNLASSDDSRLYLSIDSDANPLTGDLTDDGTDYWFGIDDDTYNFARWNGADWVVAPDSTVRITGNQSQITISVNRSELGNASVFNFDVSTAARTVNGDYTFFGFDHAPDDGLFNYSLDANGPQIISAEVQTTPSSGPRAGKRFVIVPTALKLPPDARMENTPLLPESYSCTAKLGVRTLNGTGTGTCTFSIPKKKARGKRLTVVLTVNYQGATKSVPLTFKVA
jgi:hypothetical protein